MFFFAGRVFYGCANPRFGGTGTVLDVTDGMYPVRGNILEVRRTKCSQYTASFNATYKKSPRLHTCICRRTNALLR